MPSSLLALPRAMRRLAGAALPLAVLALPLGAQDSTRRAVPASPAAANVARPQGTAASARATASAAAKDTVARLPNGKRKPAGWPVKSPPLLPGSILPAKRIVAYYGNPLSKRMGALGQYPVDEMLQRLDREVRRWNAADPSTPVQPALHLIAVVASGEAGTSGKWRTRMDSALIEKVYGWAKRKNALLFIDVQVGKGTLQEELPRLEKWLARPDVHLGIDPEFSMKTGHAPGKRIGSFDAVDINYASKFLQDIVTRHKVPPKVFVIHRFTRGMVTNAKQIRLDPRVQVVMHMDGWGGRRLKEDSYEHYIVNEPVQYTGFKIFYGNDTRNGTQLMTPQQVLQLYPKPLYIQYQ